MKKHLLVSILLVATLTGGGGGLAVWFIHTRPKPSQNQPRALIPRVLAPPVEAVENHRVRIVGYGSARPKIRMQISPQVAGEIVFRAPTCRSGEYVGKGQVLLEIDKSDYVLARDAAARQIDLLQTRLASLDQEKANLGASAKIEAGRLELAERQLAKAQEIHARGASSSNELDTALEAVLGRKTQLQTLQNQLALLDPQRKQLAAEIALARVQLSQAELAMERTTIRSPVTGRVLSCTVEAGERVAVGQVCCEVYDMEVMEVPVSIPASDLRWLEMAGGDSTTRPAPKLTPAEVLWHQPDDGRELRWRGKVERVEAGLAAQTRTATVVAIVTNPPLDSPEPKLDLNMFCKVMIEGRQVPRAFLLPRRAILADQGVYVVNGGRLMRHEVRISRLTGQEAMVLPGGGVEEGDRVVCDYVPKPVLGMRVEAIESLSQPASRPAGP